MHLLTVEEWDLIGAIITVIATLSAICALVTIVTFIKWRRFRTTVSGPVCLMAIADLISMAAYSANRHGPRAGEDSALCQWQGSFVQIGDLSVVLCTACIAMDLLLVLFSRQSVAQIERLHTRVYTPVCIIIPLIVGLVPLGIKDSEGNHFYGDSGDWCWISEKFGIFQFLFLYGPVWLVFLFNLTVYAAGGRAIWRLSKTSTAQLRSTDMGRYKYTYIKHVSLYLLAFASTWTLPTINRIYGYVNNGDQNFVLFLLHATFLSSNGIMNCVVYFYIAWMSGVITKSRLQHASNRAASGLRKSSKDSKNSKLQGQRRDSMVNDTLQLTSITTTEMYGDSPISPTRPDDPLADYTVGRPMGFQEAVYDPNVSSPYPASPRLPSSP